MRAYSKFDQVLRGQTVSPYHIKPRDVDVLGYVIKGALGQQTAVEQPSCLDQFAIDNFSAFCNNKSRILLDLSQIHSIIDLHESAENWKFIKMFLHKVHHYRQGEEEQLVRSLNQDTTNVVCHAFAVCLVFGNVSMVYFKTYLFSLI